MSVPLSLVVTTRNNAETLAACLDSATFAAETLVLDSDSTDATRDIAASRGARVIVEAFRGYGPQKQRAVDLAAHDWVLLLDADEVVSEELGASICNELTRSPRAHGFRLQREEHLYWRWPAPGTRLTDHLRLFDRRHMTMSDHPVHAAPEVDGPCPLLNGRLRHLGQGSLHAQVQRINEYTSGAAEVPRPASTLRLLLAPAAAFLREYLMRRQFLNGWAGYTAARVAAFHAFLRHAKRLEDRRVKRR